MGCVGWHALLNDPDRCRRSSARHRQAAHEGHFFQPAEDMFWFLNKHNELVRGTCVIHKQAGYPMDTVASHDYFGRGKYTTDIPSDAFALTVPKGVVCN